MYKDSTVDGVSADMPNVHALHDANRKHKVVHSKTKTATKAEAEAKGKTLVT